MQFNVSVRVLIVWVALISLLVGLQPHAHTSHPSAQETHSSSAQGLSSMPVYVVGMPACGSVLPMPVSSQGPHWSKLWSADCFCGLTLALPYHFGVPCNHWAVSDPGYQQRAWSWFVDLCCWLNLRPTYHHDPSWWSGLFVEAGLSSLALPSLPCSGTVGLERPMPWQLHHCTQLPTPYAAGGSCCALPVPFSKVTISFACRIHTWVTW